MTISTLSTQHKVLHAYNKKHLDVFPFGSHSQIFGKIFVYDGLHKKADVRWRHEFWRWRLHGRL